eukprot:2786615-Alexandrium_andersonii.AAC.1
MPALDGPEFAGILHGVDDNTGEGDVKATGLCQELNCGEQACPVFLCSWLLRAEALPREMAKGHSMT